SPTLAGKLCPADLFFDKVVDKTLAGCTKRAEVRLHEHGVVAGPRGQDRLDDMRDGRQHFPVARGKPFQFCVKLVLCGAMDRTGHGWVLLSEDNLSAAGPSGSPLLLGGPFGFCLANDALVD